MRKIEWTQNAVISLNEILGYYRDIDGDIVANNIYNKILKELELLEAEEIRTKQALELKDIGIYDVYELTIKPWKLYYKLSDDNKKVFVLFVLDGRRNLEEILISKILGNNI